MGVHGSITKIIQVMTKDFESFKFKVNITGSTPTSVNGYNCVIKILNFRRTLEMHLINSEIIFF